MRTHVNPSSSELGAEPFHWLDPVGRFRARARVWFVRQLKCEKCAGDGHNMGLDGPELCGACKATGNKNGKY